MYNNTADNHTRLPSTRPTVQPYVTLPVSQIIADWKQQNATDAVQKIARFAAMFGSVTHSHQPHVT